MRAPFIAQLIFLLLLAVPYPLAGQSERAPFNPSWEKDTLKAAVKTDYRRIFRSLGKLESNLPVIRGIVSPLGEGDPIKWIQTLPGVTTGADGTSSIYVRGGNVGNNVLSLDGVPVHGFSHLAGLTTVVSQDAISSVSFSKGGFEGWQGNFTASQMLVRTRNPEDFKTFTSMNNFMVSVGTEGRIKSLSYLVTGRVSPLAHEYRAIRSHLPGLLKNFNDFSADVGDVFGKVRWEINEASAIDAFALGSIDRYAFTSHDGAQDVIGWSNAIGMVRYIHDSNLSSTEIQGYVSHVESVQSQEKTYRNIDQGLSLSSSLTEYSFSFIQKRPIVDELRFSYGIQLRDAVFAPGQVGAVNRQSDVILATVFGQADYVLKDRVSLMAAIRGNAFWRYGEHGSLFSPDASLSARWQVSRHFGLEVAMDKTSQFYHTLEGLPVGWSIDMIVPSGSTVPEETAVQGNAGFDISAGGHHLSAGAFYKRMNGLVYFKYAPSLFRGAMAAWEDNVDRGEGVSYGLETLYEYHSGDFDAYMSYTLSKTDREGFASVNDGAPFNARFDRRHVLNASVRWKDVSAACTYQSGNWDNAAPQTYVMHVFDDAWSANYFSGVNNYQMPTVIRLDLGYNFSFVTGKVKHDISLGVCNVTNHFNPFMLYFDAATESWKELSLLPILPNFSYKVSF